MSVIEERCIEFNEERKICIAYENGKTYRLESNSRVTIRKIKVDKCLYQEKGEKRCDYLMDIQNLKRVIFIELKGGRLIDAVKQITDTIEYLKNDFKDFRIDARIVGSRDVPNFINNPAYLKLAKKVLPTKGTIERATNNIYIENI